MCSEEFQNTTFADSLPLSSLYMVIWATTSAAPLLPWQPSHHETIWRLQLGGLWHRPLLVCFRTNKRQEPLHWKSFLVPPVVCCSSFLSSRMQSPWSQNGSSPHWWTHGSLEVAACQIVRSMESGQDKPCPKLGASLQRQKHRALLRQRPVSDNCGQTSTAILGRTRVAAHQKLSPRSLIQTHRTLMNLNR